jgi:hypothetical protein
MFGSLFGFTPSDEGAAILEGGSGGFATPCAEAARLNTSNSKTIKTDARITTPLTRFFGFMFIFLAKPLERSAL